MTGTAPEAEPPAAAPAPGEDDPWLRELFDESRTAQLLLDPALCVQRANAALRALHPAAAAIGTPATRLFADPEGNFGAILGRALSGIAPDGPVESRLSSSEGGQNQAVDVAIDPLREPGGTVSGLHLRLVDRTERVRLETELAAGRRLQAIGQLAGGIAHDFNNLLTAIVAGADLILSRTGTDPETRDDARQIRLAAERGAALVRQLLAFGGRQPMQLRVVPVDEAVRDLSGLLRRVLGARVLLALALEAPGRMVRVDPAQLDQVLVNLAVNARDAMPAGGMLTIRTAEIALDRPSIRGGETIPAGRYVTITVEDIGHGIPPGILPRIFDPFFTTKRERGGTGLGLSTVQGIVLQSGGRLGVESEAGRGTAFCLYFPPYEPASPASSGADESEAAGAVGCPAAVQDEPDRAGPADGGGRRVLLVEDDDSIRALTARAATASGWVVLSAPSAESALALLDDIAASGRAPPSLLISDVVMPGADGPSLVAAVRSRCRGLPAILVSGYAEEATRQSCQGQDIAFLSKPYSLRTLFAMMDELTAGRSGAGEPPP